MAGDDEAGVARVFALLNSGCDRTRLCEALITEGQVDASCIGPKQQDLLKLLMGALELLGPRLFLERTGTFIEGGASRQRRRKVAVYGGAFDPITNSHLTCAAELVHANNVDEVWLVPCGPRRDKPNLKTPAIDRYCMCEVAVNTGFSPAFPVKVIEVECLAAQAFDTYDLLCSLRSNHPDVDLAFVIGTDWLQPGSSMCDWTSKNHDWKPGDPEDQRVVVTGHKMLAEFDFLVIQRPGYAVTPTPDDPTGLKQFGPRLAWLEMPEGTTFVQGNLSSTEIRKRAGQLACDSAEMEQLRLIDGLVPRAVLSYIRRHDFYNLDASKQKAVRRARTITGDDSYTIAVYAGSFNPVTNSHLTCAAEIVHSGCADEVWIVPCGPKPGKASFQGVRGLDRYCMCKIGINQAFTSDFPIRVIDVECFADEALDTYDLLCKLREQEPDVKFSFVIGSDWLYPECKMTSWTSKNWDWKLGDPEDKRTIDTGSKLVEEFDFLVVQRPGDQVCATPTSRFKWLVMPEGATFIQGNAFSTEVRKRTVLDSEMQEQRTSVLDGLVPPGVAAYIGRHNLYFR